MQLRVTRHTERLDEVVALYRDGIGLTEIGGFRDHDGYDGVFLAVPGTGAHLEHRIASRPAAARPRSHPACWRIDQIVRTVTLRTPRLRQACVAPARRSKRHIRAE
jgi:hypothetical protein